MSGIINKIGETLHIGGHKKEDEHKGEKHGDEHKGEKSHDDKHKGEKSHDDKHKGEHKEGIVEKLKDKIHGGEDHEHKDLLSSSIISLFPCLIKWSTVPYDGESLQVLLMMMQ
ncbi:dehydrin HIRD11 [Trifolium repens]|nr:dehydrin HIRD11 [Trifolium repens]